MRHSIKYECSTWNKKDWQNEITIVNKQEYRDKNCFAIVEMWNNSIISTFLRIRGLLFPIWRTCQCNCFWSVESFSICLIEVYFTYTFFRMKGMFGSLPLGHFYLAFYVSICRALKRDLCLIKGCLHKFTKMTCRSPVSSKLPFFFWHLWNVCTQLLLLPNYLPHFWDK